MRGANVEHQAALHAAVAEVYGVGDPAPVDTAGRTDVEICRAILLDHGLSALRIDEGLDDLRDAACAAYARLVPHDLSATVLPGVRSLLETLAARADVRLSLVTGNLEPIARLKLERAGLGGFFARGQGGFGSDSEDRAALPPIARRRADRHPRDRTILVGDTPRDIACARADGLRCHAVATGPYRASELRAAGADAVAGDAVALRDMLERALG